MSCKNCKYSRFATSLDEFPEQLLCFCHYSPHYDDYVDDDYTCYMYTRELTEPNEPNPELDDDLITEPPKFT